MVNIHGFEKLTLLDYPTKLASTIFIAGCNLRCPFCHNSSLVLNDHIWHYKIEMNVVLDYLSKRKDILEGVCITGGEPLLDENLELLCQRIKDMGLLIKLDTNGTQPSKMQSLIAAGLVDYIAMDIKNDLTHYGETVGIDGFDTKPIEESVRILQENRIDYEFRTTVVKDFHNEDRLINIAKWIKQTPKYFLQTYRESDFVIKTGLKAYTEAEMKQFCQLMAKLVPSVQLRG